MSRRVMGPALARLERVYESSRVKHVEGESGVLELYVSERRFPDRHFAVFWYEPGVSPVGGMVPDSFETSRFLRTSASTLEVGGDRVTLTSERGGAYEFVLLEGGPIELLPR